MGKGSPSACFSTSDWLESSFLLPFDRCDLQQEKGGNCHTSWVPQHNDPENEVDRKVLPRSYFKGKKTQDGIVCWFATVTYVRIKKIFILTKIPLIVGMIDSHWSRAVSPNIF